MTLTGLSIAYLRDRALNTALNILILALAVATLVILALFSAQLGGRFQRDAEGVDLVVGAKGSPLQLILSAIYQVDAPTGNVPLDTLQLLRRDPTVEKAIPLALGDNFRGFRIVGTEPAYPRHYGADLGEGAMFAKPYEAVIGADVARRTGARVGQRFVGSHGLGGGEKAHQHEETPFTVVGVLKPTGAVIDRLILTSVESVWDVHGIDHEPEHEGAAHHDDHDAAHAGHAEHDHDEDAHDHAALDPGAREAALDPEITAVLVSYRSPLAAVRLPNFINRQTNLQAAAPAVEIARLMSLIGVGLDAIRAFAVLLMATGGLSIFAALYAALRQRQGDMAILRVLGATPLAIFGQIILEGVILATLGACLGVLLGHGVVAVASQTFPQLRDMGLSAARFEPAEVYIVLAAIGIGMLAALLPALRVFRVDLAETLNQSA